MEHLIIKIKSVTVPELYKIKVLFDDLSEKVIDLSPVLSGPMFGPLKDPIVFRAVKVDAETATLVWPNGADFDPATLYEWNQFKNELTLRAREWQHFQ